MIEDSKQKIPCGGFYIGEGLELDNATRTLKSVGGSGGGGFKVTITFDDDLNVTADKTYAEVKAAIEAGELVYGVASVPGLGVGSVICGGYLEDNVIHFEATAVNGGDQGYFTMIWFNYMPDGTFDFGEIFPPVQEAEPPFIIYVEKEGTKYYSSRYFSEILDAWDRGIIPQCIFEDDEVGQIFCQFNRLYEYDSEKTFIFSNIKSEIVAATGAIMSMSTIEIDIEEENGQTYVGVFKGNKTF